MSSQSCLILNVTTYLACLVLIGSVSSTQSGYHLGNVAKPHGNAKRLIRTLESLLSCYQLVSNHIFSNGNPAEDEQKPRWSLARIVRVRTRFADHIPLLLPVLSRLWQTTITMSCEYRQYRIRRECNSS